MNNDSRPAGFNPDSLPPLVIVVSGPSGVGKDAVLKFMKQHHCPFHFVLTMTTRQKRNTEKDLVDYHFVSKNDFQQLLQNNGLLEWAEVYGNWYGVPQKPVRDAINQGKDTIIKVDVQGAFHIKKILPDAVLVFIYPPSFEELSKRLHKRRTESTENLSLRLKTAELEMEQVRDFDYVVINPTDDVNRAVQDILAIIRAEKCRVQPRKYNL
ncbi:MAG: guanylate kinase [Dehalococcoidales bacterium]|nr:guanylate kinase [Dehalococcoidales bacterium]